MKSLIRLALSGAAVALPSLAMAHVGADAGDHHGFSAGFIHPLTGTDHLVAMVAVGAWSALTARHTDARTLAAAPLSFAGLLLTGALLAAAGLDFPAIEPMIAASLLVLGLLVALRQAMAPALGAALVGGFALFHGAAHGGELAGGAALAGMVVATALLHAAGLGLGWVLRTRSVWLPRAAGLASAAFGLSLLLG
ncbi:HupE/UreJ family protein [Sphaerotilus natans]|uniref:HupE/UreJ family protein n=1 Tax=Sphaerotilus natans TaxID=34103 RepID=UPI00406D029B